MSMQAEQPMSWQDQLLDVLSARARTWFVVSILLILLAALLSLLAPGTLPPTPLVGLVIGLAAVLLATAVVFGLDISDVIVRGRRHVEIAGGSVAGTISRSTSDIDALVELIDHHAQDGKVRVALTPASRSAGVPGSRANIVATELAGRGAKVLVTDLTRGGTPAVGLSDVISGDRSLGEAVRFDDELYLAHLAVGSEPELALEGFSTWSRGLPPDLDVLVAALPPLSEPGVLPAVDGVELVLLLVEVGRTERVDLIASLDAIDAAEVPAELVLVDDDVVVAPTTGSGSVEVLSTPGSSPRQRDPGGFDLQDGPASVDTSTESTGPASDVEPTRAGSDRAPDVGVSEAGSGSSGSGSSGSGSSGAGSSGTGGSAIGVAAAGAAAGAAGVAAGAAGAAAGSTSDDDLRSGRAGARDADPDEFDDPEDTVVEPGGGHVRTVHRRPPPRDDDTIAMSPDELPGGGAPLATSTDDVAPVVEVPADESPVVDDAAEPAPDEPAPGEPAPDEPESAEPSADQAAEPVADEPVAEPVADEPVAARADDPVVPVPDPAATQRIDAVGWPSDQRDEPTTPMVDDAPDPVVGESATTATHEVPSEPAAHDVGIWDRVDEDVVDDGHDAIGRDPHDHHADQGEPAAEDEDPIDAVAREQQRLAASLQQLAQDVWRRGDGT